MRSTLLNAITDNLNLDYSHTGPLRGPFIRAALSMKAIHEGKPFYSQEIGGFFVDKVPKMPLEFSLNVQVPDPMTTLWRAIHRICPFIVLVRTDYPDIQKSYLQSGAPSPVVNTFDADTNHKDSNSVYMWPDGVIDQIVSDGETMFKIVTTDKELLFRMVALIDLFVAPTTGKAKISVIVNSGHGPNLLNVGEGGVTFNPGNYTSDIVEAFEHVVDDLASDTPCGRLVILTGPPGCGKTFFLEGLIDRQTECRYILLPPAVLSSVAGPELLQSIMQSPSPGTPAPGRLKKGSKKSSHIPIVFLIEDADQVLVKRGLDTLPSISAILNLADGILGRALDVRIVATSNAKKQDIDDALIRDGRLCRAIDFTALDYDQANAIFEREVEKLTGKKPSAPLPPKEGLRSRLGFGATDEPNGYVLAEVYRAAKHFSGGEES